MASMRSIARLHREQAPAPQSEREQVKTATVADSQPDVSMLLLQERSLATRRRGRFKVSPPGLGGGSLDPSMIMSTMVPCTPVDRAADFQALAAREAETRWLARRAPRGDPPGPQLRIF